MTGDSEEVFVSREQRKPVLAAGGRNEEIDRAGIDSFCATDGS